MEAVVKLTDFSIEDVLAQNDELRCKLETRDHQIKLLEEKINYLLYHRFNSKSERFDERQQLLFDNEDAACEVEPTTEVKAPEYTRKTGGRRIPPNTFRMFVWSMICRKKRSCVPVVLA